MFLRKLLRQDPGSELDDIVRNLNYVLKTKRGIGYFLDSFGMSDVGHRTVEEMITTVTDELSENIALYEPRVELMDIDEDYDEDTGRVRLTLECRVKSAGEIVVISLDPSGQMVDIRQKPRSDIDGEP